MTDLDDLATRSGRRHDGAFVPFTKPERDDVVVVARWAQNAPHHADCPARFGSRRNPNPCTCGRDEALAPFGGSRG